MFSADRVAGGVLGVLGLVVLIESRGLPLGSLRNPGPAYMPVLLALLLLGFGVLLAVRGGFRERRVTWSDWRHAIAIVAACAFAALALERLGYRLTMLAVLVFLLAVVERRSWLATSLFALALAVGSFFLFGSLLKVPLPVGPFGL